jgi:hypothetical protein
MAIRPGSTPRTDALGDAYQGAAARVLRAVDLDLGSITDRLESHRLKSGAGASDFYRRVRSSLSMRCDQMLPRRTDHADL